MHKTVRILLPLAESLLLAAALLQVPTQAQTLQELMEQASDAAQKKGESRVRVEQHLDPLPPLGFTGSMRMEVRSFTNGNEQKDSPARVDLAFDNDRMAMALTEVKVARALDDPARVSKVLETL